MILEIWHEPEQDKEQIVRLRLVHSEPYVELWAVDNEGNRLIGGTLLRFDHDGTLVLCPEINSEIGLRLDDKGRIALWWGHNT